MLYLVGGVLWVKIIGYYEKYILFHDKVMSEILDFCFNQGEAWILSGAYN